MENRLFLLDAYALIYRAYYALIRSPRITSNGFNTSAIFGFCNTLDEVLRKENPSHIAVCFDPAGPTFRHEAFTEYKANREKQPEDITLSIPFIKDILAARGIKTIEINGYEADDVIGTLSRKAEKEGFLTYMMTPDKDYGQLVTSNVLIYKPSLRGQDFEIRGVEQIKEKYGISDPIQVIDMLALEGDSIDNIPGCPGIGPKTATKLIQEFGSVENLINSVNKLKGSIKDKIEKNSEQILFSKFLATIKTDVPLNISIDSLKKESDDTGTLKKIYEALEFRSLINRLQSKDSVKSKTPEETKTKSPYLGTLFDIVPAEKNVFSVNDIPLQSEILDKHNYLNLVKDIDSSNKISFLIKSVGENAMRAKIIAFSIAISSTKSYIYFVPPPLDSEDNINITDLLGKCFGREDLTIVTNDVKRLKVLFREYGFHYNCSFFDISIAHYLINPEERHFIPELAYNYLNYKTSDYDIEPRSRKTYEIVSRDFIEQTLPENTCIAFRLYNEIKNDLEKNNLLNLYNYIELPLATVLADMEITGVRIDIIELNKMSVEYTNRLNELETQVYELAGCRFNIGSPSQVGEILFDKLNIDSKAKKTKKGGYSTTEEILEKYKDTHPIVDLILKIRQLKKLLATYINALPQLVDQSTGKVHTTYNQTVTTTGRLSSTNPNLQNIPVRGEDGREIRKAFIADDGCIFMAADYNQIELRLMADFSKDPHMMNAFKNNVDIHQDTAARIFHKNLDEVTSDDRRKAKTANFGIIYGISPFGLSERLKIPRSEAKQFINDYMETYPSIKNYIGQIIEKARADGFVSTITGRKRYLNEINSQNSVVRGYGERNAVNAPLQGSAADIIKKAMVSIQKRIYSEGLKSRMIMQVHDELIFNVWQEELTKMQQIVAEEMGNAYDGEVSMTVSIGNGRNWLEAH